MTSTTIQVWTGNIDGVKVLIACRSERRASEILQIPIIKLRTWEKMDYAPWMRIGIMYQYNLKSGVWEET